MKKYIIIILAAISTLSLSFSAEAYTREELEEQVRSEMSAAYSTYNSNKEKLAEVQNTLNGLDEQKAAALKELEEQVRNDQITDSEYKKKVKEVEKNYKNLEKAYKKQKDGLEDMISNFDKEFDKRMEEIDDKMAEQQKNAEKADKKTKKLKSALAECEAMVATSAKRKECAEKAMKKYALTDEEAAAAEQIAADNAAAVKAGVQKLLQESMEEEIPEEEIVKLKEATYGTKPTTEGSTGSGANANDGGTGTGSSGSTTTTGGADATGAADGSTEIAGVSVVTGGGSDTLSGGNAGNPSSYGGGSNGLAGCTSGDIFDQVTCKVLGFVSDLRLLAYIISGFGMIVFTYGAIFNKINWKHFSYIAVSLFLLSVMGSFIQYFSGDKTAATKLGYGNHMSGGYSQISGSTGGGSAVSSSDIPNVNVGNTSTANIISGGSDDDTAAGTGTDSGSKGFSLKDLASSLSSGIKAVKNVYNAAVTTEGGLKNIGGMISNIKNAIENNKTDWDGLVNTAMNIAGSISSGTYDAKHDVNSLVSSVGDFANNVQDIFSSAEKREENQQRRAEGEATNKVTEWLQNQGSKVQEGVGEASNDTRDIANSVVNVANETNAGNKMGGDALGATLGAAQAIIETVQPPKY